MLSFDLRLRKYHRRIYNGEYRAAQLVVGESCRKTTHVCIHPETQDTLSNASIDELARQ